LGHCEAGQAWSFDNVRFEVLHPARQSYSMEDIGDNDRSCVLRIESEYGVVLLPADIERRSEHQLLANGSARLQADVLVAPHHGSRTSSSEQFIAAVAPQLVLFPVGYANRYGHPHAFVEARYRNFGATLLRTDELGAITLKFTGSGIDVAGWRQHDRRYWHGLSN
jgi:competence protein ComEC